MQSKTLNFPDAMKLASIVSKYFDTVSILEMNGEEFAYSFFNQMDIDEIIEIKHLLITGYTETSNAKEVMASCVKSMIENNFVEIIKTWKSIGLDK
jgi:hypothetical protein